MKNNSMSKLWFSLALVVIPVSLFAKQPGPEPARGAAAEWYEFSLLSRSSHIITVVINAGEETHKIKNVNKIEADGEFLILTFKDDLKKTGKAIVPGDRIVYIYERTIN